MASSRSKVTKTGGFKTRVILLLILASILGFSLYFAFRPSEGQNPAADLSPDQLVKAELLANTEALVPGREFLIGVRFKIAPKWYIYWKDPGDAGLPTTLDLKLPKGLTAGDVLYPEPVRFNQPGNVVGYGYREDVMLLARLSPPAELPLGETISLFVRAQWLACRDKCILGEQDLELSMPIAGQASAAHAELFGKWLKRIPKDSSTSASGYGYSK